MDVKAGMWDEPVSNCSNGLTKRSSWSFTQRPGEKFELTRAADLLPVRLVFEDRFTPSRGRFRQNAGAVGQ